MTALSAPCVRRIDLRYEFPFHRTAAARGSRTAVTSSDLPALASGFASIPTDQFKPHACRCRTGPPCHVVRVDDRTYESDADAGRRHRLSRRARRQRRIALRGHRGPHPSRWTIGRRKCTCCGRPAIGRLRRWKGHDRGARRRRLRDCASTWSTASPVVASGSFRLRRLADPMCRASARGWFPPRIRRETWRRMTYYARARDVARGKQSTLTERNLLPRSEAVQSRSKLPPRPRRWPGPTGTELESLVAAQKEIISATWNLERRSAAGRSAADIRRLPTHRPSSRPARSRPPVVQAAAPWIPAADLHAAAAPDGGGDPVVEAVAAMTRATLSSRRARPARRSARNGSAQRASEGAGRGAAAPGDAATGQRRQQRRERAPRTGSVEPVRSGIENGSSARITRRSPRSSSSQKGRTRTRVRSIVSAIGTAPGGTGRRHGSWPVRGSRPRN